MSHLNHVETSLIHWLPMHATAFLVAQKDRFVIFNVIQDSQKAVETTVLSSKNEHDESADSIQALYLPHHSHDIVLGCANGTTLLWQLGLPFRDRPQMKEGIEKWMTQRMSTDQNPIVNID